MKQEQKNNPVVVAALSTVFVGAVGLTIFQMRGGGDVPSPQLTPVSATAVEHGGVQAFRVQETAVRSPKSGFRLAGLRPSRDPFFHPAVRAARGPKGLTGDGGRLTEAGFRPTSVFHPPSPLLGPSAGALPPLQAAPGSLGPAQIDVRPLRQPATPRPAPVAARPAVKLTAVIEGSRRTAIVETPGSGPTSVRVGDRIEGARIAAIHDEEIVLSDDQGFWTVSLLSPDPKEKRGEDVR